MSTSSAADGFDVIDVPELVPARMLNEFTYCPRLFFLEWVHAQFADNTDTVEGRWHHRAADKVSGAVPLPDEGEVMVARSVLLSSTSLGLVAKIDLLEGAPDGTVVPVDTKRGSPPDTPERAWEPERVQVCAQGLLLREHGYSCDHGVLWFAESRQRVGVDFDDALISRTLQLLAELRAVAASSLPPAPLVDSPKCPRCSLVGICLPDEVNTLSERSSRPPRLLVPRDDAPRPLYVTEQGATVSKDRGRIEVKKDGERLASVRAIDVSQVCVYGNVQISAQLLRELFASEIPVCWFSHGGWFSGLGEGLPGRNVELRRRQTIVAAQGGLDIAQRIVNGKILNSRTLLRRNTRDRSDATLAQLKRLAEQSLEATSVGSLLGIEGTAARIYFGSFATMLREEKRLPGGPFTFEGRNRRPPTDPVNCLLGYAYGLLTKELTTTAYGIGFDPYQGFFHRPRFGRPALALDLAEEFRPLIAESVVVNLINNGEVTTGDFIVRAGGVALTQAGRRAVIAAYERRMAAELRHPVFGYRVSYRRALEVQCRLLAAHLLSEIPHYTPVTTR
ncbi:MAG: CRISPR-associated endonuclease Cas4g/Cas1g [Acidimicrobiales bacterium]